MILTGNRIDAADLVQDTWERALSHYSASVSDEKVRGWLLVIMKNIHVDIIRRNKVRGALAAATELLDVIPAPELEPEPEPAWSQLSVREIYPSLDRLASPLRRAIELHAFERRSYQEISRVLHIAKTTVGTRLFRARRRLRRLVTEAQLGGETVPEPSLPEAPGPMLDRPSRQDGRSRSRSARAMAWG
jgi:RNA polymerase sigma-70 factor (ECF subfamily)